jgi:DNA transposition AAA+ family ATPase
MHDIDKDQATPQDHQEEQARISIPGDSVLTALNRLISGGEIDEDGKTAIWWFFGHARDKGMTLIEAGRCIDRDPTTVHRLFHGKYGASYANLISEIVRYRKLAEERAKRRDIGFIETTTWRKISVVCRGALYDSMPAYIYGASQIGKTACLEEYARRNNHGQSRYIRMPAAPSFRRVLALLADACFISNRHTEADIMRRMFKAIDDRTLLIFDEFHQVFIGCGELTARKVVEFIREIYDRTHCGIAICGTEVVHEEFERGRQRMVWDQFRRRGMVELVLPAVPPKADILKIGAAFGLPEPDADTMEVIRDMLKRSGIGMYFKYLQLAHGISVSKKETLTWAHFMTAHKNIVALSRGA